MNDPSAYTLSAAEAAERLGVSHDTLRRWVIEGLVPCIQRPGKRGNRRFRPEDIDVFAAEKFTREGEAS